MSLADMLLAKEKERQDKVKSLLIKAYRTAKMNYREADVWVMDSKPRIYLMKAGKVINKEWFNRIVVSYLTLYCQKLIEKGDTGVS